MTKRFKFRHLLTPRIYPRLVSWCLHFRYQVAFTSQNHIPKAFLTGFMAADSSYFSSSSLYSLPPIRIPRPSFPASFRFSVSRRHQCLRFAAKGSDAFDFFPWSNSDHDIEWVQQEKVTLFTADGLVQIGGSVVPRRVCSSDSNHALPKSSTKFQRFQECNYMDPNQGLCLGALFDIAATNGLDVGRRFCIIGFCRSIEMLSDVVEDTVLEHGGEVVVAEKAIKGGLHEKLTMTVAVPYLWGVPPASETLHLAVRSGGGIVDKVYWQWDFL